MIYSELDVFLWKLPSFQLGGHSNAFSNSSLKPEDRVFLLIAGREDLKRKQRIKGEENWGQVPY